MKKSSPADPFRLALAESLERTAEIVRAGKRNWIALAQAEMESLGGTLDQQKIEMVRKITSDILKMKERS